MPRSMLFCKKIRVEKCILFDKCERETRTDDDCKLLCIFEWSVFAQLINVGIDAAGFLLKKTFDGIGKG